MDYSIEEFYVLAGREGRVATMAFAPDSENFKKYGKTVTVLFKFSFNEIEKLKKDYDNGTLSKTKGAVRAKYLTGGKLTEEQKEVLKSEGIFTEGIQQLVVSEPHHNLYHEEKVRTVTTMNIPFESNPGDKYRLKNYLIKQYLKSGMELMPDERDWHIAFQCITNKQLSDEDKDYAYPGGVLLPSIEVKILEVKDGAGNNSTEENERFEKFVENDLKDVLAVLKNEISSSGLNMERVAKENSLAYGFLTSGVAKFNPKRMNAIGKRPVYLDWKGFLHIFIRHVKELEIGLQSKHKAKFKWTPDKILWLIGAVVKELDKDIQKFWEKHPGTRYGSFADQSHEFEGDYYTIHIEWDGRISTFHRTVSKKKE